MPSLRQKLDARGAADRLPEILHFLTLQEMIQHFASFNASLASYVDEYRESASNRSTTTNTDEGLLLAPVSFRIYSGVHSSDKSPSAQEVRLNLAVSLP
jgi:hypothetical protein